MYVKDQEYPPGIHPVGYVSPFPNWLAPVLLIAAAGVLLGWMPNPFGEKRKNPRSRGGGTIRSHHWLSKKAKMSPHPAWGGKTKRRRKALKRRTGSAKASLQSIRAIRKRLGLPTK